MSAESMKFPPPARKASMTRSPAANDVVQPQFIVPRHSSETLIPVGPSARYSMARMIPEFPYNDAVRVTAILLVLLAGSPAAAADVLLPENLSSPQRWTV